jgi:hypothetical protein
MHLLCKQAPGFTNTTPRNTFRPKLRVVWKGFKIEPFLKLHVRANGFVDGQRCSHVVLMKVMHEIALSSATRAANYSRQTLN